MAGAAYGKAPAADGAAVAQPAQRKILTVAGVAGGIDVRVTAVDGSDPAAAGTQIRTPLRDGLTVAVVIAPPATESRS